MVALFLYLWEMTINYTPFVRLSQVSTRKRGRSDLLFLDGEHDDNVSTTSGRFTPSGPRQRLVGVDGLSKETPDKEVEVPT